MLFIPAGWWHYVVGLEKSITIGYDFFNRANFGDYFVDFIRALPETLKSYEGLPSWRKALGVKWVCKGFDRVVELDGDACKASSSMS